MTIDPVGILLAVAVFALAVAAWAGLWWLIKTYATPDQKQIISDLVKAAEQQLQGQAGEEKLAYVLALAQKLLPRLDTGVLRALIEAAVYELGQQQQDDGTQRKT